MKRTIILTLLLTCGSFYAQDTLYFKDNSKKIIVLLEVNPDNVKFKRYDNQAGAVYTVPKTDLSHVVFSNGASESFAPTRPPAPPPPAPTDSVKTAVVQNTTAPASEDFFSGSVPDTLLFNSGKRTPVRVLIVNDQIVKYKLWQNQDGPTYEISKTELKQIAYGNGKSELIVNASPPPSPTKEKTVTQNPVAQADLQTEMYRKGMEDAKLMYNHGGGSKFVGTMAFLTGPIFGLIPAVIISNCEPKRKNLGIPTTEYARNTQYQKGYTKTAYKMKKKRVWTNYGIGSAVLIILVILLSFA